MKSKENEFTIIADKVKLQIFTFKNKTTNFGAFRLKTIKQIIKYQNSSRLNSCRLIH